MKYPVNDNDPSTYVVSKLDGNKYSRITHKHVKKYNMTLAEYCNVYNLDKMDLISDQLKNTLAFTKDICISKYGEVEGLQKWNAYCERQSFTNTYDYKHQKYGMSKLQFDEYNRSRAVTLENLIRRHGDDKGNLMWAAYCKKQATAGCSLDYFIEKYGCVRGEEIYKNLCSTKAQTLSNFINRYGVDEGTRRYNSYIVDRGSIFSKISQDLFAILHNYTTNKVYYANNNNGVEFHVNDIERNRSYFYDYVDVVAKKCIEFNGDVFHGNPATYSENDTPNPFSAATCAEIWEYDKTKINHLKKHMDIDTLVVWESDYRKCRTSVVEKCLNFLEYEH